MNALHSGEAQECYDLEERCHEAVGDLRSGTRRDGWWRARGLKIVAEGCVKCGYGGSEARLASVFSCTT